jgi:menaquinol-cytochrome c reductase cytochrome b subunit
VPILGPFIADFLQGGAQIGPDALPRWYALHMLLIPGLLIFLILFHLYLVVRLGVSSPPWSKEAAGEERVDLPEPQARRGLVAPAPRGGLRK